MERDIRRTSYKPKPPRSDGKIVNEETKSARKNMRRFLDVLEKARKSGFPITGKVRKQALESATKLLESENVADRTMAMANRVILGMERLNVDLAIAMLKAEGEMGGDGGGGTTVNVNVNNSNNIAAIQHEPKYLEYLRRERLERDRNAGALCGDGEQECSNTLEDGAAPCVSGPENNGHDFREE